MARKTRLLKIGSVNIGSDSKVSIQTMTKTDICDLKATTSQINECIEAGVDLVRLAVPTMEAAVAFGHIKSQVDVPLIADIHFDYKLAIASIENGADSIRINPGNIDPHSKGFPLSEIVAAAKLNGVPIRVGVNGGSISPAILRRFGTPSPEALVESAIEECRKLEALDFTDLKVSLKSSSVVDTVKACRLFDEISDYPQHIGVTETGLPEVGIIKSAVGIGSLLLAGIGDTIRVSLTGSPVQEVITAKRILAACGIGSPKIEIISCPSCGRTHDPSFVKLVQLISDRFSNYPVKQPIKIAVMGCEVNGPGEAREADIGIASTKNKFTLFAKGKVIELIELSDILPKIEQLLDRI